MKKRKNKPNAQSKAEHSVEKTEQQLFYTDDELDWLYNLSKKEILAYLEDAAAERRRGDRFRLQDLFVGTWEHFRPSRRRQANKEFKIKVSLKLITTVYFLPKEPGDNDYIYVRR